MRGRAKATLTLGRRKKALEAERWHGAPAHAYAAFAQGHAEFSRRLRSVVADLDSTVPAPVKGGAEEGGAADGEQQQALRRRIAILQMELNRCMAELKH